MENKRVDNLKIIVFVIIFISVFLIGGISSFYLLSNQKEEILPIEDVANKKEESLTPIVNNKPYISAENQPAGDYVLVKEVKLIEPGWLVAYDGPIGEARHILGAQFLPAGEHRDIIIWLQRGTMAGDTYLVAIHDDDGYIFETEFGRHHFDYQADLPIKNSQGEFIFDTFKAEPLGSRG